MMINSDATLESGGSTAPVGGLIMAQGLDHFFTGLQTAFSGNLKENGAAFELEFSDLIPYFSSFLKNLKSPILKGIKCS